MDIYRGYEIGRNDSGLWEWIDEEGRTHNGKVDLKGGYKTEEDAMTAIDQYRREKLAAKQ